MKPVFFPQLCSWSPTCLWMSSYPSSWRGWSVCEGEWDCLALQRRFQGQGGDVFEEELDLVAQ